MNRFYYTLLYTLLLLPLSADAEEILSVDSVNIVAQSDSAITSSKTTATGFNSLEYLMAKRYVPQSETFRKRWYDHLYMEVGLDVEHVFSPSPDFKFTPATMGKLAIGKQFNKYNSLRVSGIAGYTYQKDPYNFYMMKIGGRLDHIYDLSSYLQGYKANRKLSVSTVLGAGVMFSRFITNEGLAFSRGTAYEGHAGLQFKIYTGPQASLNIEPYIGIATDNMDVSEPRNWRKYDGFYGANVTYTHYFRNNLSPEVRKLLIENRKRKEELTRDSLLFSWRKPFFVELSNSMKISSHGFSDPLNHIGNGYAASFGKWFSPVAGIRASVASENATNHDELEWRNEGNTKNAKNDSEYPISNYKFIRMEALFNPLGFAPYYNWDAKFGGYAVIGLQYGYASQVWERGDFIKKRTHGYTAGIHLWTKLSKDLQFFIEPRFEHNTFHIPRWTTGKNERYKDDLATLNFGISVYSCPRKYTYWDKETSHENFFDFKRIAIGGGWGVNCFQPLAMLGASTRFGWNGQGYIEFNFDEYQGARLTAEYTDYPSRRIKKGELISLSHEAVPTSLSYMVNLSNLMSPAHIGRRNVEAYIFAGPSIIWGVNDGKLQTPQFAFNFGTKILYKVNENIALHLTPTLYRITGGSLDYIYPTVRMHDWQMFETINVGIQYSL